MWNEVTGIVVVVDGGVGCEESQQVGVWLEMCSLVIQFSGCHYTSLHGASADSFYIKICSYNIKIWSYTARLYAWQDSCSTSDFVSQCPVIFDCLPQKNKLDAQHGVPYKIHMMVVT